MKVNGKSLSELNLNASPNAVVLKPPFRFVTVITTLGFRLCKQSDNIST